MPDKQEMAALKASGLNAAWFKRYEHMCAKYAHPDRGIPKNTISPLIESNLEQQRQRRKVRRAKSTLPMIGVRSPESENQEPEEEGKKKKKKAPVVQVKRGAEYVQPAMLRTMEARLNCKVTAAADPYSAQVRRISHKTNMSAKRIEQLSKLFLDASRGLKKLDPPSFRKLMCSVGQDDRSINDRLFELLDVKRDKQVDFESFCTAILTFKTGTRSDQAALIFKVIDVSDDRNLSKFELLKFFCSGIKEKEKKRAMSDVVNEVMACIDEDGSGEVDHDEFVAKVAQDEEVWILFDAISPFTNMKEKLSKFEFKMIDHSSTFDDEV